MAVSKQDKVTEAVIGSLMDQNTLVSPMLTSNFVHPLVVNAVQNQPVVVDHFNTVRVEKHLSLLVCKVCKEIEPAANELKRVTITVFHCVVTVGVEINREQIIVALTAVVINDVLVVQPICAEPVYCISVVVSLRDSTREHTRVKEQQVGYTYLILAVNEKVKVAILSMHEVVATEIDGPKDR